VDAAHQLHENTYSFADAVLWQQAFTTFTSPPSSSTIKSLFSSSIYITSFLFSIYMDNIARFLLIKTLIL
jgi:hypothetical protein